MKSEMFSPKSFLKSRRPERFSDSTFREKTEVDRSLLEYHLESLTSRSQETDFERFARRLCEREICPNLLPQTGPTGGGDSKVDSETYPVADHLALTWYVGNGREAARERWAFAFSAKARWRPKVKSDIEKIAGTGRGYEKAFFVTNQSVPDRKRAEVEDLLRSQHDIDVRILDRTWILDRVFSGGHEDLALEELGVTALSRRVVRKGASDAAREEELEKIETLINEDVQSGQLTSSLVDKVLEAAALARSLERPRPEIEGRYRRAIQMTEQLGSSRQKVEAAYQWAWTLYWWFEDYDAFVRQYRIVEELAAGSRNSRDLEQISNLWFCFFSSVLHGKCDAEATDFDTHTEHLIQELQRLSKEKDRPSTALEAETQLHHIQIASRLANDEPIDDLLDKLRGAVLHGAGLIGYPLETFADILTEIGPALEVSAAYDRLFETVLEVIAAHDGEVRAAELLLARGEQQLHREHNVEAIATLGRSLRLLYKHETRYALVRALYLCGSAYDSLGLAWAARGTLLSAASVATDEFWRYGDVTPYQAACYGRLKWIELLLGRLPHVLAWHELDMAIRQGLASQGFDLSSVAAEGSEFEIFLGRLLLRTAFADLEHLVALPDVLDRLGLDLASDALLYVLGHEERLEETCRQLGEEPGEFASRWWGIESDTTLPDRPELYAEQEIKLNSRILGCRVVATCQNSPPCVEVGESLLAALESFLATSIAVGAIAREPELVVHITLSDAATSMIDFVLEEKAGRPHLIVHCSSFDPYKVTLEEHGEIREILLDLTIAALARVILFTDYERSLQALLDEERALERALSFTGTFVTQANVLGDTPKVHLEAWVDESHQTYPLIRDKPWQPSDFGVDEEASDEAIQLPDRSPSGRKFDPNVIRHDEIETVSLIRESLWREAQWSGVAYDNAPGYPPIFAPIFKNKEAGQEIFAQWRQELGEVDKQEQLRLVIVRGIDQHHPHHYRVIIGANPELIPANDKLTFFVSRLQTMEPTTSDNLDRFLAQHARFDAFLLAPAFTPSGFSEMQAPILEAEMGVLIHSVHVREAWEIGPNDIDVVGVWEDDEPIIPPDVEDPPVLQLLPPRNLPGRNEPCICGSGKKFKKCCLTRIYQDRADRAKHQ